MKIQENKIQEHNGTSFSITKVDGVSMLQFDEKSIISNIEDYATIILGDCTNCKKIKDLYHLVKEDLKNLIWFLLLEIKYHLK